MHASPANQTKTRRLLSWTTNLLLVVVSVAVTCFACEGIARLTIAPRSSGIGMGILNARFRALHHPRPSPADTQRQATRRIIFLGDSFTKGAGVDPSQSFPSRVAAAIGKTYEIDNLGRDGANTLDEAKLLSATIDRSKLPAAFVVHQYFGNDIEYLIAGPHVPNSGWFGRQLLALCQVSYLADYLYQPIYLKSFGSSYIKRLFRAYRDRRLLAQHLVDLDRLWSTVHSRGSALLFVVFPFLHNHLLEGGQIFKLSREQYIAPLTKHFLKVCKTGDGLLDVAALIVAQPDAGDMTHWIANRVDPHPSAELHGLVAQQIVDFITRRPSRVVPCPKSQQFKPGP